MAQKRKGSQTVADIETVHLHAWSHGGDIHSEIHSLIHNTHNLFLSHDPSCIPASKWEFCETPASSQSNSPPSDVL